MLVSIDPGLSTGWALWSLRRLVACGLGDPRTCALHVTSSRHDDADVVRDVWIEEPVIYPRSPVPPNDIRKLAMTAARWAGRYDILGVEVHFVTPAEWKGQVPKDIHHARIWSKLSAADQDVVNLGCKGVAPSKRHNVIDAIGIGLYARR